MPIIRKTLAHFPLIFKVEYINTYKLVNLIKVYCPPKIGSSTLPDVLNFITSLVGSHGIIFEVGQPAGVRFTLGDMGAIPRTQRRSR
jgi:hypothetical protein